MDASDFDKVRYWKYKLEKQQKNGVKQGEGKGRNAKHKIAEKSGKKQCTILTQDNFFSNTIQKLKTLLQDNSHKKSTIGSSHKHHNKQIHVTKIHHQNEGFKKVKKEQDKSNKSHSMLQTKRERFYTNETTARKEKEKATPSKSRSKSRKYKGDKHKKDISWKKEPKISPSVHSGKVSKKKSLKTKCTTKRVETIQLPNMEDEDGSWKKKLMETVIVHEKSISSEERQPEYVSNFRVWQEYEQQLYNKKKKNCRVILTYLQAFSTFQKYTRMTKDKQGEVGSNKNQNGKVLMTNFKQIVKTQEQKMLQLKEYLCNLKNSDNLNQSLQILIGKVNQNISHLKNYDSVSSKSGRQSSKRSKIEHPSKQVSARVNSDSLNSSFNRQVVAKSVDKQFQNLELKEETKQIGQEQQKKEEDQNMQIPQPKVEKCPANNNNDNHSLSYSFNQRSPTVHIFTSVKQSQPSFSFKQDNSFALDVKFQQIQLKTHPQQHQPHHNRIDSDAFLSPEVAKDREGSSSSNRVSSSSEDMLLSISNHKIAPQDHPDLQHQQQVPPVSTFVPARQQQPKNYQEDEEKTPEPIKIEQPQQQQQIQNPVFQRSHPIRHQPDHISQLEFELIEPRSHFDTHQPSPPPQLQPKDQQIDLFMGMKQKNMLQQKIFQKLMIETAILINFHPLAKQHLLNHFNNLTIDIVQQKNYNFHYQTQQEEQPEVTPINATDYYLIQLTQKAIQYAYHQDLPQRIVQPLGVPSLYTLKYMRKLNANDDEEDNQFLQDQDGNEESGVGQYTQIIDSSLFQTFDQKFSCQPQNPYQMILNRCLYDGLNFLLDEFRPFGNRGLPGICIQKIAPTAPTLPNLTSKLTNKINYILNIKMGYLQQQNRQQSSRAMQRWQTDAVKQLQKQFNYRQEDDTIQRYEMMLEIEQLIFDEEAMLLNLIMAGRQQQYFQ